MRHTVYKNFISFCLVVVLVLLIVSESPCDVYIRGNNPIILVHSITFSREYWPIENANIKRNHGIEITEKYD